MTVHFDEVLQQVGGFGRFQQLQCIVVQLIVVFSTMHAFNMVFTAAVPKHRCRIVQYPLQWDNLTEEQQHNLAYIATGNPSVDSCTMFVLNDTDWDSGNYTTWVSNPMRKTMQCQHGWNYDTDIYKSTIVNEWDLVCDRSWYQNTVMSIFMAGRIFSSGISGQISDRFGRRPVLISSLVLLSMAGILVSICKLFWLFCILYFLQGAFQISLYNTLYVLGQEMVGPDNRLQLGILFHTSYVMGQVALAGISFLIRQWAYINIAISAPLLLFLPGLYWLTPESVRWLLGQGEKEKAFKILTKVAEMNGKTLNRDKFEGIDVKPDEKKSTMTDILRRWKLALLAFNIWFQAFCAMAVYYGISLNTPNLAGNPYLNFTLLGGSDPLSFLIAMLLQKWISRKKTYLFFVAIAAVSCTSFIFVPKDNFGLILTLAFLGKLGVSASCMLIFIITLEVFPTSVRNSAYGVMMLVCLTGSMVSSYIIYLRTVAVDLPQIVFGALSVVAFVLGWFIPETADRDLPQTIDDMRGWSKNKDKKKTEKTKKDKSQGNEVDKSLLAITSI